MISVLDIFFEECRISISGDLIMQNYSYQTRGVCAKKIDFEIEDGKLHNVKFTGGCPGNTAAVGKLLEGMDADKAVAILKGNDCNGKGTSCADQLAIAVEQALAN